MSTITKQSLDNVFHAYDIRGRDPEELNAEFFEVLGKAFVTFLKAKKIAIGNDIRRTGPEYKMAFIKGANSLGCDVVDIGEIGTEMLYFAVGSDPELDGGATITASHNPAGWNGCKMVSKGAAAISGDNGLEDIKELMFANQFEDKAPGKVETRDVYPGFKEKILSYLDGVDIKPLKIVVDAGNGIGGKLYDYVFAELPVKVTKLYFEPDDTFPNHVPNPIYVENVRDLIKETMAQQADIGIAIDGDGDRTFFVDNKGRNPDGIYTGAIFAKEILKNTSGEKIIQDPRVTWPVTERVKQSGGIPIFCKAGHSFFKKKMKEEDALFGAENSSHFYYRDFYHADSGMITLAMMIKFLSEGVDFDEELDYLYEHYPISGEVNYTVKDTKESIARIESYFKENYPEADYLYIDGITVEFDDWRFNLRPSNTQPLIRLNLEGKTKGIIVEKFKLLEDMIGGIRDNEPALAELQ